MNLSGSIIWTDVSRVGPSGWISEYRNPRGAAFLSASLNMSYALALHIVLSTYWLDIRQVQTCCVCVWMGRSVWEEEKKVKNKRRIYFLCTLVSIFANSSMQVSEHVSLNKFHFMHEYRGISVWIIVLAFDRKIQSKVEKETEAWSQREEGVQVRGCRQSEEVWPEMKCVIWEKCWGATGLFSPLSLQCRAISMQRYCRSCQRAKCWRGEDGKEWGRLKRKKKWQW